MYETISKKKNKMKSSGKLTRYLFKTDIQVHFSFMQIRNVYIGQVIKQHVYASSQHQIGNGHTN